VPVGFRSTPEAGRVLGVYTSYIGAYASISRDELQLYGYSPFRDEPDPRPLPDAQVIASSISGIFDALVVALDRVNVAPCPYSAAMASKGVELARDDGAQVVAQLRGLPTAVHTLETLLRLHPVFLSALETRVAGPGQPQNLTAPVGRIWLDRDQAVASRGRILRPSVVRSTTSSAASVLIDIEPWRLSLARIHIGSCATPRPQDTDRRTA
jgi:hypothetical protein